MLIYGVLNRVNMSKWDNRYIAGLQKRAWIGTVWLGHADPELARQEFPLDEDVMDAYRNWWAKLSSHPSVKFAEGQIEVGSKDNLHIQVAVKTSDSKRWSWMAKHLPASWQPAENPVACENYCTKTKDRIEYLGVVGTKTASKRTVGHGLAKQRALRYLKDGHTPAWIAVHDADAYFTHWRTIEAMHEIYSTAEAQVMMAQKMMNESRSEEE